MALPPAVALGPWPQGIDNIHPANHRVFQPPSKDHLPRLLSARDLDLDDQGWPRARRGTVTEHGASGGAGIWSAGGRAFVQFGDALFERTPSALTLLAAGFSARVVLAEHWGKVYATDGRKHVEIDGSAARNWGLPVPAVTLTPVAGSLRPGRYLACAAFVDAAGNEGGCSDLVAVAGTGFSVAVTGASQSVVAVNLYASRADQPQPSFVVAFPLALLPFGLVDPSLLGAGDPPKTAQMIGPILAAEGIASHRAFLLMWRGNAVFRSEAAEPHLFHPDNILQFPSPVTAVEGTAGGLWVGTERGLWWVVGGDSGDWVPVLKTHEPVARGSHRIQGAKLPGLDLGEQRLALFVSESGLIAATEDGGIVPITAGRYRFDPARRYRFAYTEHGDLRQLLILGGDW